MARLELMDNLILYIEPFESYMSSSLVLQEQMITNTRKHYS
jgi:hypothetical protein